ncbi:MAG: PadR family transcriptional regulator [Aphanocapsa lilacina HA4352-LM1]|jgi:DNA-binding PadR family transcriptional regulator|nr:PadR family transcriptional regulator [Aphanocapsa lilacina HA4352-LM1]
MALTYAILAVLAQRPASGYEIFKRFEGAGAYLWQATHQQIYRELNGMEALGYVTATAGAACGQRPARRVYRITEQGLQQLADWIAEPCDLAPTREPLAVKLLAGHLASPQIIGRELERHRLAHRRKLLALQKLADDHFADPEVLSIQQRLQYLALRRAIGEETAWLAWFEESAKLLGIRFSTPEHAPMH